MRRKRITVPMFQLMVVGHSLAFALQKRLPQMQVLRMFQPHLWVLYIANDMAKKLRRKSKKNRFETPSATGFHGNLGALVYDCAQGETVLQNYTRHSGAATLGAMNAILVQEIHQPIFNACPPPGDLNPRTQDSEFILLNYLAQNHALELTSGGNVTLFTSRPPCESCRMVISSFLGQFVNVTMSLYFMNTALWVKKPNYSDYQKIKNWSRTEKPQLKVIRLTSR